MKITDYKKLLVERSNDFIKDNMTGIVVKTAEEIGQNVYGVYIGQLMYGTYYNDGPYEKDVSLDTNKCLNSINKKVGEKSVTASNYIHLTMFSVYNLSMPRLIKGENVLIGIIDQDIKSIYIKPFNRNQIKNRPTDTLEMFVPSSGKYEGEFLDDDNKYYVKLDSVAKTIRIHMSDSNGEVSKYDINIDGTNGNITLTDSVRTISLNTENDEIIMSNESGSTIAIRKEIIDMSCDKFYLKAKESINIECPKTEAKLDNVQLTTETFKGDVDKLTLKGSKQEETYDKAIIKNSSKREITSPMTAVDGAMDISDNVNIRKAISFGAPKGQSPLPTNATIKSDGSAVFDPLLGMPVARAQPLVTLLTQIAMKLDLVGANPMFLVPAPVLSPMVASMSMQIPAPKIKG